MRLKKYFLLLLGVLFLSGCGTYGQIVQVDDSAYLLLIGNPQGNIVTIDNNLPIDLIKDTTSFSLNGEEATKIRVSRGKHTITIQKNGITTVNRKFYVSTGTSFEVKL